MNYLEIYLCAVVFSLVFVTAKFAYKFKVESNKAKLKSAIDGLRVAVKELCESVGVVAGTLIASILSVACISVFIASLPILLICKTTVSITTK
jgi:hypothetical protein